jgi:hypothetical protein
MLIDSANVVSNLMFEALMLVGPTSLKIIHPEV